jgi:hypothetical protein
MHIFLNKYNKKITKRKSLTKSGIRDKILSKTIVDLSYGIRANFRF